MSEQVIRCGHEHCCNTPVFHVGNVYTAVCERHHKYAGAWGGSHHYYDACQRCEDESTV